MKTMMTTIYSLAIGSLCMTASLARAQDATAPKEGAQGTIPPKTEPAPAAAPATKVIKKKITKAKTALSETGEEGPAVGVGASKQEPRPTKYNGEVEFQFGYSSGSGSSKPSADGQDETKTSSSTMSLGITYQFIFGKFGVGPILQYSSTSQKKTIGEASGTGSTTSTGLGLAAEYFLFDVQTEKMVPFVGFNYLMTSGSNSNKPSADSDETKTTNSGNQMGLGGGLKYFLGRHVSVDPALWYVSTSSTTKYTESSNKDSATEIQLIAGLSTYF